MATPLRLFTLGRLRLVLGDEEQLAGRRKLLALLAYLALHPGPPIGRAKLAALFWGDRTEPRARQSLRQALRELRDAIGDRLEIRPDCVRIPVDAVEIDVHRFQAALRMGDLRGAAECWAGEFLPSAEDLGSGAFTAWLETERERLRRLYSRALEQAATVAEERGEWSSAAAEWERYLELDPLSETHYARWIGALRLAGRQDEAAAAFAMAIGRMRSEYGVEPSAEFLLLAAIPAIRAADRSLAAPRSAALLSPDLVGRGTSFQYLVEQWNAVRMGAAAVIVVEGEEGIGKTRLCEGFLRWVSTTSGDEARIFHAQAFEAEIDLEGALLRELFSGLAAAPGIAGSPDEALAVLVEYVPAIQERYPHLPAIRGSPSAFLAALNRVLTDVASEVAIVIFVDDLPQADRLSRQFVLALARRLPARCLLLFTKSTSSHADAETSASLRALRSAQRIALAPLTQAEVEVLLESMLSVESEQRPGLAQRLQAESSGNPLYIVTLIAALTETGRLAPDEEGRWHVKEAADGRLPLSETTREIVQTRLQQLSPSARAVLNAASALGRTIEPDLLARLVEQPATEFCDAIEELIARRLLRIVPAAGGQYEFSHGIIRRVTSEQLGPARRAALQQRIREATLPARVPETQVARATARATGATREEMASEGRRVRRLLSLLMILACMAAGAALTLRRDTQTRLSTNLVVVLPFSTKGSAEYSYLGEGMVDLLSANLDGAGELRSIPPRALLGWLRQQPTGSSIDELGSAAALRFGAGLWIVGDIVEAAHRIRITATLHSHQSPTRPLGWTSVEGEAADLFRLVDRLTVALLADRSAGPTRRMTRLAMVTTESMPALKSYLEGEHAFRAGRFSDALQAFQHAVAADTGFALAHYRLSISAEWFGPAELALDAAEAAVRHSHRLSDRDRHLLQALHAARGGGDAVAERLYRQILATYPDDVEAWMQLGEVLFHYGAMRGRSITQSRSTWERVLQFELDNTVALYHLARIAAIEGNFEDVQRYEARLFTVNPDHARGWSTRAIRTLRENDSQEMERLVQELRDMPESALNMVAFDGMTFGQNPAVALPLLDLLVDARRPPLTRAWGYLWRAHAQLAQGRWNEALHELSMLEPLDAQAAADYRALFHVLPFLPRTPQELAEARVALRERPAQFPGGSTASSSPSSEYSRIHPWLPEYLLGLLSARMEDTVASKHYAARLSQVPPSEILGNRVQSLAITAGSAAGSPRDAEDLLSQLAPLRMQIWYETARWSGFYGQAYERYLLGETLRRLGRWEEALGWYATLGEVSPFDLPYLAPAHQRQGEILEALGRRDEAVLHYSRMVELWQQADSNLQPVVEQVRQRIGRLKGGTS
jgi:DNA-binding SARP family transcriptional activator